MCADRPGGALGAAGNAVPRWQYLSLLAGWHSIRLFLTLQVISQGILVVGLSFWVTALATNTYSVKLIFIAVLLAAAAVLGAGKGIFSPPRDLPGCR